MGQRYEKSKKSVSENRTTFEKLSSERETLKNEYAPLSLLDSVQSMLEDETSEAIQGVRTVGEFESQRIETETDTAEKEKKQITSEIDTEISKLNAGLEKLRKTGKIEFGKKAIEQSSQEYKKQIEKFKKLIGELGDSSSGKSASADSSNSELYPEFTQESSRDSYIEQSDSNVFSTYNRFSSLSESVFSKMNPARQRIADFAFSKAPPSIVDALNSHAEHLQPTMDTGYSINEIGQRVKDGCYYSPDDRQVRMDESLSDEEYGEILPHELSHFLDHERGWESRSSDFINAVQSDLLSMDKSTHEGRARMNEMLDDAFSTGAAFDRNVSDIISAVFVNDPEIIQRFYLEGVPYYQHSNDYWARPFSREAEIYANNGAVQCSNERISKDFLERYFSHTYNQFSQFYSL